MSDQKELGGLLGPNPLAEYYAAQRYPAAVDTITGGVNGAIGGAMNVAGWGARAMPHPLMKLLGYGLLGAGSIKGTSGLMHAMDGAERFYRAGQGRDMWSNTGMPGMPEDPYSR